MIVSVASGKGGTGKTTIAVALAQVAPHSAYVDCDTEAPNGHLFLRPNISHRKPVSRTVASINVNTCTWCGECMEKCAYHAIVIAHATRKAVVFEDLCMGCGVCAFVCPARAITEEERHAGIVSNGHSGRIRTREGRMAVEAPHAHPVLTETLKELPDAPCTILDAEPGVTGRVVTTVRASDVCVLVTEPTPFGLHDLELAVTMTQHVGVPVGVIINRSTIGDNAVRDFCRVRNIPVLLEIPFDRRIAAGYAVGKTLVEILPDIKSRFAEVLRHVERIVTERGRS